MKPPMIQGNSRTPQAEETAERWATKKKIVARGSLALIVAALLVLGLNKWTHLSPQILDGIAVVLPVLLVYAVTRLSGLNFRR